MAPWETRLGGIVNTRRIDDYSQWAGETILMTGNLLMGWIKKEKQNILGKQACGLV